MGSYKLTKMKRDLDDFWVLSVGDPVVDEYLGWMAGRKSENTRLAYGYDLLKFLDWIETQVISGTLHDYLSVKPFQILQFVNWLTEQPNRKVKQDTSSPYAAATLTRVVRAVTHFYDYLVLTERVPNNAIPDRALAEARALPGSVRRGTHQRTTLVPSAAQRPPEILEEQEIHEFMANLKTQRDKLLFELLLFSGIRISEALNLRLPDINFAERSIKIQPLPEGVSQRAVNNRGPKRNSSGIVGVHPRWFAHLNEYLASEYPGNPDDFIFVVLKGPHRGQQLTYKGCYAIIAYHRQKTGTLRIRPHRARHTFVTRALRAGIRREVLKKQLRHTSDKSLDAYTWVSEQELLSELEDIQDVFLPSSSAERHSR